MNKRLWRLAVVALILVMTAACANNRARNEMQPLQERNQARQWQQAPNQPNAVPDAEDRIEIAQAAAERIVKLPGVRQANVLVTRNNAYVAAVLDTTGRQLSRELEDQIAREVRKVRPNIRNVYVSSNPEFVDRINAYMLDVQQGRPVAGFAEQLNEMVQRLFPEAR